MDRMDCTVGPPGCGNNRCPFCRLCLCQRQPYRDAEDAEEASHTKALVDGSGHVNLPLAPVCSSPHLEKVNVPAGSFFDEANKGTSSLPGAAGLEGGGGES